MKQDANVGHGLLQGVLSLDTIKGCQKNKDSEKTFVRTKEYVWRQNKDYVGRATC